VSQLLAPSLRRASDLRSCSRRAAVLASGPGPVRIHASAAAHHDQPKLLRTPGWRQRSRILGNTRDPPGTLAAKAPAVNAARSAGPRLGLQPGAADLSHP
jgi:hypothetical protein